MPVIPNTSSEKMAFRKWMVRMFPPGCIQISQPMRSIKQERVPLARTLTPLLQTLATGISLLWRTLLVSIHASLQVADLSHTSKACNSPTWSLPHLGYSMIRICGVNRCATDQRIVDRQSDERTFKETGTGSEFRGRPAPGILLDRSAGIPASMHSTA